MSRVRLAASAMSGALSLALLSVRRVGAACTPTKTTCAWRLETTMGICASRARRTTKTARESERWAAIRGLVRLLPNAAKASPERSCLICAVGSACLR